MPPDLGPDDPAALQAIILAQQQKIARMEASGQALEALIQALALTIARLKRQRYGSSSEKIDREIAQLELALEGLGLAGVAADATPESDELADAQAADDTTVERRLPPRRRGKPRIAADAPRESIILDPGARCPGCGGALRLVGEDVAEILDFIAAKLKVVEVHRPKESCRDCERMVQTPAPAVVSWSARPRRRRRHRSEGSRPRHPTICGRWLAKVMSRSTGRPTARASAVFPEPSRPLTVRSDRSRHLLATKACPDACEATVQGRLVRVFIGNGLPDAMLADNGNPLSSGRMGASRTASPGSRSG